MYAVVGFCSPSAIARNVSSEARIVTSASVPPSVTFDARVGHVDLPDARALDVEDVRLVHPGRLGRVDARLEGLEELAGVHRRASLPKRESATPRSEPRLGRGVALDQRVRELPLRLGDRDAVALELDRPGLGCTQRLALER